ncbi:MAG TPA: NAD(P)-dependent oxidoreductase [Luteimonas sp.]|nr:NAD(P)-dependent oxidoreductase [Luteimonas sp.]
MGSRIFLAGASGAIGRRLGPMLRDAGHRVAGTTRSADKAVQLRELGIEPVVVDVFDAEALRRALAAFRAEIVVHQLTDLPRGLPPERMDEAIARNARIRDEGTRNLVAAARDCGARRLVAQSIAWAYAPGAEPHAEGDPLDLEAAGMRATSVRGVAALERWTLQSPPIAGTVLRYGQLYGPGTGADVPAGAMPLHVDAAARAAVLAIERGATGIFNIAEPNDHVSTRKAATQLDWRADFRGGDGG